MRLPSEVVPLKERNSMLFLKYGRVDVDGGAFVLEDAQGVRMQIPVGGVACIFLEPGITITHAAVALAADTGTLLIWVGEGGVRLYASGQPGGARADRLLHQARLALDDDLRLKVVRAMYAYRFQEEPPQRRSVEQLRGLEGIRVREMYKLSAAQYKIPWGKRSYNPQKWDESDMINRAVSVACHCLYGVCEAAVLAAGYAPAIGFLHTGKPLSFVYDIADLFKFETAIPAAFKATARQAQPMEREVRLSCRDMFRESNLLRRIIPVIDDILSAGGTERPKAAPEAMPVAIPNAKGLSDVGHRN